MEKYKQESAAKRGEVVEQQKLRVCDKISDERKFLDNYVLLKKVYCRGDFWEIKQVKHIKSGMIRAAKIFRKSELTNKNLHPLKPEAAETSDETPQVEEGEN